MGSLRGCSWGAKSPFGAPYLNPGDEIQKLLWETRPNDHKLQYATTYYHVALLDLLLRVGARDFTSSSSCKSSKLVLSLNFDPSTHLAIRLDSVLEAVEFPTGITHLDSGLADMDRDAFPHFADSVFEIRLEEKVKSIWVKENTRTVTIIQWSEKGIENWVGLSSFRSILCYHNFKNGNWFFFSICNGKHVNTLTIWKTAEKYASFNKEDHEGKKLRS